MAPCACGQCVVCKLFGSGDNRTNFEPTRLLFRDCQLTPESTETLITAAKESGVFFAEIKPGIRMNRATNSVAKGAFFNFERVPEGTEFAFELVVRLYGDLDTEQARVDYRKVVARGLQLLEKEGIGGKISAGYGKIEFRGLKWDGQDFDHRKSEA
jgi:CRISPR-associated protein Csm3